LSLPESPDEVGGDVGWSASPPPIMPAAPVPVAVASSVDEALVARVEVVLNPLDNHVESEPEPHVEERDESIEDVTLVVPEERWLDKVVVVETDVEEEFVEVRNEIVEFDRPLKDE